MGCHIWFYQIVERSFEEAIELALLVIKYNNTLFEEELLDNESFEHTSYTKEDLNHSIKNALYLINLIEQFQIHKNITNQKEIDFIKEMVWQYQPEPLKSYIEGKGYFVEVNDFHDIITNYGYTEGRLFSLEEAISYINNPENKCIVYENTIELLTEFWERYPEGMIEFG